MTTADQKIGKQQFVEFETNARHLQVLIAVGEAQQLQDMGGVNHLTHKLLVCHPSSPPSPSPSPSPLPISTRRAASCLMALLECTRSSGRCGTGWA